MPDALVRWRAAGLKTYIYSSGSRQAQADLFGNTSAGDLRPYLCGFFDTTSGLKAYSPSSAETGGRVSMERGSAGRSCLADAVAGGGVVAFCSFLASPDAAYLGSHDCPQVSKAIFALCRNGGISMFCAPCQRACACAGGGEQLPGDCAGAGGGLARAATVCHRRGGRGRSSDGGWLAGALMAMGVCLPLHS